MQSIKRLLNTILLLPFFAIIFAEVPEWSVNPADYQFNGSVTSKVYIDDLEVGSTSDLVAAFVNGEVRGVVNGLALPPFLGGGYSFNVMIFSNQAGGETVSFKYYDAINDVVIDLSETLVFSSDMVVGNATAPFELNGTLPDDGDDGGGSVESCGDHTTWSINPADYQFNGSVTSKVYLDDIEVGSENDILAAFVGDEIRGLVNGLALPPFLGGGYSFNIMIFSNAPSGETVDFKFYQASSNTVICLNETVSFVSDMVVGNATAPFELNGTLPDDGDDGGGSVESCGDHTTWSINPADYQFNGSVTSKVYLDDIEVGSENDILAAFVGDEIRGLVNGLALPPFLGGGYSFNIMIFSNAPSGETVDFKFYQASSNTVVCLNETVSFVSDMVVGNATAPFELTGSNPDVGTDLYGCTDADACNYNNDATADDGSCTYAEVNYDCDGNCTAGIDCLGECGGSAEIDECGVCDGSGIPDGYCDCNGNIIDCLGECGGSAEIDECGVCDGSGIPDGYCDCNGNIIDCLGECGGSAEIDECGVCDGSGIPDGYCDCNGNIIDCLGECGGSAEIDECGVCDGSGIPDGYCDCNGNIIDCLGECGGSAEIDECGVCDGSGIPDGYCDCNGNILTV